MLKSPISRVFWTAVAIILTFGPVSVAIWHNERTNDRSTTYTVRTLEDNNTFEVCPIDEGRGRCQNIKTSVFESLFRNCVDMGEAHRKYTRIVACDYDVLSSGT